MLASYQLCNTLETLSIALKHLSTAKTVYLDCEGQDLGDQGGILSILSLGCVTSTSEVKNSATLSIFLIDVPAFQTYTHQANPSPLVPVFAILTSKEVLKVGFDLRMDASELRHGHDVVITHVLDLQIVDLMCRDKSEEAVLQRLAGYLAPREVLRNREIYKHVLRLSGLDKALIDQGQSVPRKPKFDHSKWMHRPLDEDNLLYAAEDVSKIQVLYELLVRNPLVNVELAIQQSEAYIQSHASARPDRTNKYLSHGLLPLAILEGSTTLSASDSKVCMGCKRSLQKAYFETNQQAIGGGSLCFVCHAVDQHTLEAQRNPPPSRLY
ncbi:SubName: Full=Uncharacterized protein {ECO:0000313/EMBL:CCA74328.1} [Serendipita indica DSM 11827]|uniref:3'-5' exonuclease domain-containing protein n=1 Tax=Serendipita indica (strain DSM 11827) TaxID=1109443 RepID=G4TSN5_SERID|nr:SubName: Full=Uncharacterized protein {ECO:0000313/EMBL:CCA74328.1} [Serendipita indica DSM 11827]CCA74328.1 hypothetical protein PIIN_08281 [Serendipita indica DSM 11827]